jgi:hypothetical protein
MSLWEDLSESVNSTILFPHPSLSKIERVREKFLCPRLSNNHQFSKIFFTRSMTSGGWVVTSFAKFCISSHDTGSKS